MDIAVLKMAFRRHVLDTLARSDGWVDDSERDLIQDLCPDAGMQGAGLMDEFGVLTLASVGSFTRFMRASMMQTLRQDFIRTASAKGLSRSRVVYGHALRNALLPLVTVIALSFGTLFSGALITETMFAWLGMGKTIYDAILGNDFNLALVGLLMATGMTLLGNVLADISYVALDPRLDFRAEDG